ncbi:MAG: MotA/TolQ/ExbB proton channel family protein [Aureliella sp.]
MNDAAFCNAAIRIGAMILLVACGMDSAFGQSPPPPNFGSGFATPLNSQPSERIASAPSLDATQSTDPLSLGGAEGVTEDTQAESAIPLSNLVSVIRKGGILMFPIMVCSVVLMVFVLERLFFLRRSRIMPRLFVRGVLEQLEQNQIEQEEAIELCEQNGSPIAELYVTALKKWGRPAVEIEQAVLDAGDHVTSQLKKYLRLFSAISNLTPLLGLLGTVLGMINAFNAIAQADAMGRPELLAAGIGGALITTAAGLCVAIPAYAAYAFFVGRSDRLILEMDAMAQDLIEQISAEAQPGTKRRSRKAA